VGTTISGDGILTEHGKLFSIAGVDPFASYEGAGVQQGRVVELLDPSVRSRATCEAELAYRVWDLLQQYVGHVFRLKYVDMCPYVGMRMSKLSWCCPRTTKLLSRAMVF
jgi:hypothetical protein